MCLKVPGAKRADDPGRRRHPPSLWGCPPGPWEEGWPPRGAGRRFEHKGSCNGAEVYDDFAHHPGELPPPLHCQDPGVRGGWSPPFSPTPTHGPRPSSTILWRFSGGDLTLLAKSLPPARSTPSASPSRDLANKIPGSRYFATLPELTAHLKGDRPPGDLILTVGAGISTVGEAPW